MAMHVVHTAYLPFAIPLELNILSFIFKVFVHLLVFRTLPAKHLSPVCDWHLMNDNHLKSWVPNLLSSTVSHEEPGISFAGLYTHYIPFILAHLALLKYLFQNSQIINSSYFFGLEFLFPYFIPT